MIRFLLLVAGIIGETAAVSALFTELSLWNRLGLFTFMHLTASVCIALLLTMSLPRHYEGRGSTALFFSFSFCIPLFGASGMILALIYFSRMTGQRSRAEFSTIPVPGFMEEGGYSAPVMGEGGAWSRLRNSRAPRDLRLKALLSVGSISGGNSSRLLQLATGDLDDEIRMLAFALYDTREKEISSSITEALAALKSAERDEEKGEICRRIAFSYWEIVYNELARDELRAFFLSQAHHYALRAVEYAGAEPALTALLGRIYLMRGEMDLAEASAHEALQQGAHPDRILPYLAELAFARHDYEAVRGIFTRDPSLRHKPGIGNVVRFWLRG